ncbi:MAG: sigma-70 family RNA polymerase sigma factor [Deltaproteobacteria bacterium]|nr:sigma-70 family RNA polymerase sigma factor [Deltaproteobacteria bacterium]
MRELVEAARGGDRRAQRALFDRFLNPLMAYCMLSANHDREMAMDLTQETFSRAFLNLGKLKEPDRFKGWLFSIAANVCRTRGVQASRQRKLHESLVLLAQVGPMEDDKHIREIRAATVRKVLESVQDEKLKKIAMLKYTEPEHTTREIANKLGIPHGTVTVSLSRFRARVKARLARAISEVEEVRHV